MKNANEVINIVFATDSGYIIPTYIAIFSLLINHKDNRSLRIYILISNSFTEENIQLYKGLQTKYNCEFFFIEVGNEYEFVRINNHHIKTPTMYRLLIPKFLHNVDKCVYLDSDLVVEGDIAELFDIDIEGFSVAGVKAFIDINSISDEWLEILNIPTDQYINAGVLLLNLQEIRKQNLVEELAQAGNNSKYYYNDQDVINVVFYNSIKLLPLKYNARWRWIYPKDRDLYRFYGKKNITEAKKQLVIYHYVGRNKPWNCRYTHCKSRWWKYVKMQEPQFINKHLISFVLNNSCHNNPINLIEIIRFCIEVFEVSLGIPHSIIRITKKLYLLSKSMSEKLLF